MSEAAAPAGNPASPAAPPTAPDSPAAAAKLLAERRSDRAWAEKLLSQDADTVKEFHDLAKKAVEGNDLDMMILAAPDLPDLTIEGKLSPKKIAGEIPAMRAAGIPDEAIRELLSGRKASAEEKAAATTLKAQLHGSPSWVEAFLRGEPENVKQSRLLSMILTG